MHIRWGGSPATEYLIMRGWLRLLGCFPSSAGEQKKVETRNWDDAQTKTAPVFRSGAFFLGGGNSERGVRQNVDFALSSALRIVHTAPRCSQWSRAAGVSLIVVLANKGCRAGDCFTNAEGIGAGN